MEVNRMQEILDMTEAQLQEYEPDPELAMSISEVEAREKKLKDTLARVIERKPTLGQNGTSFSMQPARYALHLVVTIVASLLPSRTSFVDPNNQWMGSEAGPQQRDDQINSFYPVNNMCNAYNPNMGPCQHVGSLPLHPVQMPPYSVVQRMVEHEMVVMQPQEIFTNDSIVPTCYPQRLQNWIDVLPPMHDTDNWMKQNKPRIDEVVGVSLDHLRDASSEICDAVVEGMRSQTATQQCFHSSNTSGDYSSNECLWGYSCTSPNHPIDKHCHPDYKVKISIEVADDLKLNDVSYASYQDETCNSCSKMPPY
ncbi:hypothetical protein ACLOJK_016170 [Asimina triloba]